MSVVLLQGRKLYWLSAESYQQSDGLWAREDEQKLSSNIRKWEATIFVAILMIVLVLVQSNDFSASWNRPKGIVCSTSSWICERAPLAEVCHHFTEYRGECHHFLFLRPLIASSTSSMVKELGANQGVIGSVVYGGHVAAPLEAAWLTSSNDHVI